MASYVKQLPLLLRSRADERYLVVRLTPQGAQAILLRLDAERVLQFEKFWPSFTWEAFAPGHTPSRLLPNVILAAHPSLAATVSIQVRIDRPKGSGLVGQEEFEGFLRQMHVKLWNEHREVAAKALRVDRMDAVLVDLRITELHVEGREVLHPLELAGERVDIRFAVTFTTRTIFEAWQKLFNLPTNFFFTDIARAGLQSLEAFPDAPQSVLLSDAWGTTYARPTTAKTVTWIEQTPVNWNDAVFPAALQDLWHIDADSAAAIHEAYCNGAVSAQARKVIADIYAPFLELFNKALKEAKVKGPAVFMNAVPFPEELPTICAGVRLEAFPLETLMQRFDFTLAHHPQLPYDRAAYIAPLIEFYYHDRYAEVNRWLKRRVHWLIPSHH